MDPLLQHRISRRTLLRAGTGAAAATLGAGLVPGGLARALAQSRTCAASLDDIEHVVILIQENRSFDHYFGTQRGVRGFSDPDALTLADGRPVFYQPCDLPDGYLLPFRLNTQTPPPSPNGMCTEDITHSWGAQHDCWDGGAMDAFARTHLRDDDPYGAAAMGYYTRDDIPFYRAVADAFTICDGYHCSVLGPTDPNRLYAMTGTLDPDGHNGGPVLSNPGRSQFGSLSWTTYPERLSAAGVTWKQYCDPELQVTSSNVLQLFAAYQDPTTDLYARGVLPTFPGDFTRDVLSGELPQVSWLQLSDVVGDHPPTAPGFGEDALSQIIDVLTARPDVWSRTLVLATWDENGGFFDHVVPPTSPAGTPQEWLTAGGGQPRGPIGLGFRVPMLVISPFSRGGLVCSDVLDHTSTLLFLERRFGVEVPNLSTWRRETVGDLTSALNLAAPRDASMPKLPVATLHDASVAVECMQSEAPLSLAPSTPGVPPPSPYPVPSPQSMPAQEPGRARRPSGVCGAGGHGTGTSAQLEAAGVSPLADVVALPLTTSARGGGVSAAAAGLAVAVALAVRARRERPSR
jgi:phospholipase C